MLLFLMLELQYELEFKAAKWNATKVIANALFPFPQHQSIAATGDPNVIFSTPDDGSPEVWTPIEREHTYEDPGVSIPIDREHTPGEPRERQR